MLQMGAQRGFSLGIILLRQRLQDSRVFLCRGGRIPGQRAGEGVEALNHQVAPLYQIGKKAVSGQLRQRNVEGHILLQKSEIVPLLCGGLQPVIAGLKHFQLLRSQPAVLRN